MKTIYFMEDSAGLQIFINGVQKTVAKTHALFDEILKALRAKAFDKIEDLIAGKKPATVTLSAKTVVGATWPFPTGAGPTNVKPAPYPTTTKSKKLRIPRNPKVYVFDNGNFAAIVRTGSKPGEHPNSLYDRNGTYIAEVNNSSVRIKAARTATVFSMLKRMSKQQRREFFIPEVAKVQVLKATPACTTDAVANRIIQVISEQYGVSRAAVNLTDRLCTDYDGDSLDAVELTMALEDEFGFEIPDEDAEKLGTDASVQEIIDAVRPKITH